MANGPYVKPYIATEHCFCLNCHTQKYATDEVVREFTAKGAATDRIYCNEECFKEMQQDLCTLR